MNTPKRPKIANEDNDESLYKFRTDITECEYCHLEFELGDRWSHFASHQAGIEQIRSNADYNINLSSARFPWYMHSIYQDRSVNRSRYEVVNFSELSNDSICLELEKRITKPFRTHFWIDFYNERNSANMVKKYFALNPLIVDYRINDVCGAKSESNRTEDIYFHCLICKFSFSRGPRFLNAAVSILVHVLGEHRKCKELCAAALEDLKEIQGATGIRTHLDKLPDYNPLFTHDLTFDPYYATEIFCPNRPRVYPTYCLLCYKEVPAQNFTSFSYTHMKPVHKISLELCCSKFICISASRYGQSRAVPIKHYTFPMGLIWDEVGKEYSWACSVCKAIFSSSDSFQLCFYVAYHFGFVSPDCIAVLIEVLKTTFTPALISHFKKIFSVIQDHRVAIGKFNMFFRPIQMDYAITQFIQLQAREIPEKWYYKITKDMRGLLPLNSELLDLKRKTDDTILYACPFCIRCFVLPEQAFLHLRPGSCPEMSSYNIKLNQEDVRKAEEKIRELKL